MKWIRLATCCVAWLAAGLVYLRGSESVTGRTERLRELASRLSEAQAQMAAWLGGMDAPKLPELLLIHAELERPIHLREALDGVAERWLGTVLALEDSFFAREERRTCGKLLGTQL